MYSITYQYVLCKERKNADKYHFVLYCSALSYLRKESMQSKYCTRPNEWHFMKLYQSLMLESLKTLHVYSKDI